MCIVYIYGTLKYDLNIMPKKTFKELCDGIKRKPNEDQMNRLVGEAYCAFKNLKDEDNFYENDISYVTEIYIKPVNELTNRISHYKQDSLRGYQVSQLVYIIGNMSSYLVNKTLNPNS